MSFIILLAGFAALGVYFGILFNKIVSKDFSEVGRKINCVISVVFFFTGTLVLFLVIFARFKIDYSIKYYSNEVERYVTINYSDNAFVRNFVETGIDLTKIPNDASELNNRFAELDTILQIYVDEIGIPQFIYNWGMTPIKLEVEKWLFVANAAKKPVSSFTDEKNILTLSSLLKGLKTNIMNIVNTIVFIAVIVVVLCLGIYVLISLAIASKSKNRNIQFGICRK